VKPWLAELFAAFPPPCAAIVDATQEADILNTDIDDIRPLGRWHQGRVGLLGDAAHATTPNLGQGGAQAIEDAEALARRPGCTARPSRGICGLWAAPPHEGDDGRQSLVADREAGARAQSAGAGTAGSERNPDWYYNLISHPAPSRMPSAPRPASRRSPIGLGAARAPAQRRRYRAAVRRPPRRAAARSCR